MIVTFNHKGISLKKSISLVLGSGGARGYAHVGVIEVLEEAGYEIKSISGSSMGALIGGLYACGKLETYKEWVLTLDTFEVLKLIDFSFSKNGMIKGDKVFDVIAKMIGDVKIEDLPISFTAVATDLTTQKEVWFQKGSLLDAIRASIAIPTIFTPKTLGNQLLVDGGVLNPLPTVPVLADRTDLTIAVNLNGEKVAKEKLKKKQKKSSFEQKLTKFLEDNRLIKKERDINYFTIVSQTIETAQNLITRYELAAHQPDLIIEIPKNLCDTYDFDEAKTTIAYGREIAQKRINAYHKIELES
ncbi:MAG: patatin-like phospholipase family protein [Epsilonproteobacteria bacterium]|nr:patatin-like phospholipase family protein [Campylobacterota bacterium]